jgi:hypothetical protein
VITQYSPTGPTGLPHAADGSRQSSTNNAADRSDRRGTRCPHTNADAAAAPHTTPTTPAKPSTPPANTASLGDNPERC